MQHCPQHLAQVESCIVCPPLKLLRATLRATVAEVESATTSATSRATVSPCVRHLQHCVQLRDAKVACNVRALNLFGELARIKGLDPSDLLVSRPSQTISCLAYRCSYYRRCKIAMADESWRFCRSVADIRHFWKAQVIPWNVSLPGEVFTAAKYFTHTHRGSVFV